MQRRVGNELLPVWTSVGLLVLLCGPWVLPNNKLYHQLVIVLLWLPALLALFRQDVRLLLRQPECALFALFAAWTWVVLAVEGGDNTVGKSKVTIYVTLTLVGVLLAAQSRRWTLESLLMYSSIVGGMFAIVSLICFYLVPGQPSGGRLIAVGLWDTAIMAAHAVGALAIMGAFTVQTKRFKPWMKLLLLIPAVGYVMFLGFSQTRGVWIGLAACMLVMMVARPSRLGVGLIVLVSLGAGAIALYDPVILLQRGVSYRPELWRAGMDLMIENWAMGVGFHPYQIQILIGDAQAAFKHPHNLFLDTGVREGIFGLLIFACLWLVVGWRGWISRAQPLGQVVLALWVFSGVSLLTDGIGLWLKPNADWLVTWLPIALSMVLACRQHQARDSLPGEYGAPVAPAR